MKSVFAVAENCLQVCDPQEKCRLTWEAHQAWRRAELRLVPTKGPEPINSPGRPQRPRLVPPKALPKRGFGTLNGRAALIHAVTHIEFNAINLAWDAVYRYRTMPKAFYADWIQVASEEASHFELLRNHLKDLGYDYGDFDAHNGLWEMAEETANDPMVRMALVPRVLEARGLDVTPGMIERLRQQDDHRAVAILELILEEEIGHVAKGSRWFQYLCKQRGLDPDATFRHLLARHMKGTLKGPFNLAARVAAGFAEEELRTLEQL